MLRRALFYSFSSNYFAMGIQFVSVMIIARLLTPEEMGIFSIAASLIILAQVFRDFGVGQYIIQEKELTDDRMRAAFSLTLISGWLLAALIYLASPYLGKFYESEGITSVLQILAINFILLPFGATTMAFLRREMNFKARMYVNGVASIIRATTTIVCVYQGFSYLSLAYGALAEAATTVVVSVLLRPAHLPWQPGIKELLHVFRSGWKLAVNTFMGFLSSNLTELMLGKLVSIQGVGYYSRANATINIFDKLITSSTKAVALPYFSAEHRDGQDMGRNLTTATVYITALAWPFFAFVAYYSLGVLRLLYGDQWDFTAPVVSSLCVVAMLSFLSYFFDAFLVATGHPGKLIKAHIILIPVRVILILLLVDYGLSAIAIGFALLPILKLFVVWPTINRYFGLRLGAYLGKMSINAAIAVTVFTGCWLVDVSLAQVVASDFIVMLCAAFTSFVLWFLGLVVFRHPLLVELRNLVDKVR